MKPRFDPGSNSSPSHSLSPRSESGLRARIRKAMKHDQTVPVFSNTAIKLLDASHHTGLSLTTIADIVRVDPGLTTRYLKLANSVIFRGKSITSVEDALLRIGMDEVRNLAATIGVMDVLTLFRSEEQVEANEPTIEWEMFWLHCLLTARLTEALAGAYRRPTGKEYLVGLLHDVGKMFLDRYFHREFVTILKSVAERGCTFNEAELKLHDIQHGEIGAALCGRWNLDPEVVRSIQFHHSPVCAENRDLAHSEDEQLLAICVCVADALANSCHANIQGGMDVREIEVESLPEWEYLQRYKPLNGYEIDVAEELKKAQEVIEILSFDS